MGRMHALPLLWTISAHDWVESTNTTADALAREGAREGTSVMAQGQNSGRGRWGRSWESPFGKNLYISTVLRPHIVPDQIAVLTLVAGLAAAEMVIEDYGIAVQLKWPNDIWLKNLKLGGILAELHTEKGHVSHVVVGLGLNVNAEPQDFSPEIAGTATSLYMATGKAFSVKEMAENWCHHLEHCYREFMIDGFGGMQKEYEAVMALKGETVRIDEVGPEMTGVVSGVDTQGRLLLDVAGKMQTIEAGEVVRVCS
jgi:BirA family biotin operon repressor/biotin-[acetyl-CoA-carboxylase] ligase